MNKLEKFLIKLNKIHGNDIDASKVKYVNSQTKVCLICHKKDKNDIEHGEYWQTPADCIRGCTCPKCANERRGPRQKDRMTTEKYIQKEREVHGYKYDLSKTIYTDAKTKMCFICPEHGEFWQLPYSHLGGQGCPKCAGRNLTQEEVIKAFRNIQGNTYIYDKVIFKNMTSKIIITCPIHGDFLQTPRKHLQGQGCPVCGNIKKNADRKITYDKFMEITENVHGRKYKYIKTDINGMHDKIPIICPIHGEFIQSVHSHLNGCGCPKCSESHLEREIRMLLENKNIKYEFQKKFKWLGKQSLDFYLPDYNTAIECQGLQHFKPIDIFGGKEDFDKTIKRDNLKRKLCNENNIKVLYFSHENIKFPYNVITKINDLIAAL